MAIKVEAPICIASEPPLAIATQEGSHRDGHIRVACVGHIHFVPHEDFYLEVRLLLEGHLLQRVRRQGLDVHNIRWINILPIAPPLDTSSARRSVWECPTSSSPIILLLLPLALLLLALLPPQWPPPPPACQTPGEGVMTWASSVVTADHVAKTITTFPRDHITRTITAERPERAERKDSS